MTVRGHPVQGGSVPLRKAPLRSRVYPWSTKRICGPLAFRRATEGSRVLRKGWGVKRGRETLVSLPFLPPPSGGGNAHAMSWRISPVPGGSVSPAPATPLYRRKVCRLLTVKKKGAHRLRRRDEVSRQLKKRLYSSRGLWYADNKCLQDFVGTDDRSAGLHHILSQYVEKRQMNVRSVFAALYTA